MSSTQHESINIYFHQLNEKDSAVIQRVIDFGKSQNKPFVAHPELEHSHIIISSDSLFNIQHKAVHIQLGDIEDQPCNIFLKRPLLVTRVMRALDDAVHLINTISTANITQPSVQTPQAEPITDTKQAASKPEITANATEANATQTKQATSPETDSSIIHNVTSNALNIKPDLSTRESEQIVSEPNNTEIEDEQHYDYRALVVDDSAAIRKQLELELKASHIYPEFAETGEEALEKIQKNQYDLIFLDIILPGIDGYEVCKTMRARPSLKKTPIIMLSGKTSPLDEVKGVLAGASTYLTKPVKHEQFQQTLKRVAKWLSIFAANPAT
jgi:PleD family two-component response regulator